jgi:7-keto-8-aminopelargonate synthetase-like enzyme
MVHRARAFVYTTGTPPAYASAAREALRIVQAEPWRREQLHANTRRLRDGLRAIGHPAEGADDSYIVPVIVGPTDKTTRVGDTMRAQGYIVGAVRPPTVPLGTSRLRLTVSAAHTSEQIDGLLAALGPALETSTA